MLLLPTGMHLQLSPYIQPKNYFLSWGAHAPIVPPGYAYGNEDNNKSIKYALNLHKYQFTIIVVTARITYCFWQLQQIVQGKLFTCSEA